MSQKTLGTAPGSYYEMILRNIKENVMKDPLYVCTDCGRLKDKDMELSGTMCNTCSTNNLSLDENINKFTTIVKNFQFDIGHPRHDAGENVFIKPSFKTTNMLGSVENCTQWPIKKKDQYSEEIIKQNNESSQTDLSFHPLDDVSFVINSSKTKPNVVSNSKLEIHSEMENIGSENITLSNGSENLVDNLDTAQQVPYKNNEVANVDKPDKSSTKTKETDTEVIESSVDDWLMPRKIATSPLLFSPETKDEDSDQDEYICATPTKEFATMGTCNWAKENEDVPEDEENLTSLPKEEANIISDNEIEMSNRKAKQRIDAGTYEVDDEMGENIVGMEVDSLPWVEEDVSNKNVKVSLIENISSSKIEQDNKDKVNISNVNKVEAELDEEQLLTQGTQKISKHNLKIVISSLEGDESTRVDTFIELFNPVVDSDVNQQTDFLIVGVDSENKVLRRTPKFLKAISLHTCIVNSEYIHQCCLKTDIVSLEKKFIPLDSSGVPGPVRSYIRQDHSLLDNFIFFSLERDPYISSLIEFLILQNGGKLISNIKLFNAYNNDSPDEQSMDSSFSTLRMKNRVQYRKILLYGDVEDEQLSSAYKIKLFSVFKCQCFYYKTLFNAVACYDVEEEMGQDLGLS